MLQQRVDEAIVASRHRAPLFGPQWDLLLARLHVERVVIVLGPVGVVLFAAANCGEFLFAHKVGIASVPYAANFALGGTLSRLMVGPVPPAASLARNHDICTFEITAQRLYVA